MMPGWLVKTVPWVGMTLVEPGERVRGVVQAGFGVTVDREDSVDVGFGRTLQGQPGGLQLFVRRARVTHVQIV